MEDSKQPIDIDEAVDTSDIEKEFIASNIDERHLSASPPATKQQTTAIADVSKYVDVKHVVVGNRVWSYTRKHVPNCTLCNHPLREVAEQLYLSSDCNIAPVAKFLRENNGPYHARILRRHFQEHCHWEARSLLELLEKMQAYQGELDMFRGNEIRFSLDLLNVLIFEMGKVLDEADIKEKTLVANSLQKLMQTKAQFLKLQQEIEGSMKQAEEYVGRQFSRVITFLDKLLSVTPDPETKANILKLIEEFRQEEKAGGR